MSKKFNIAIIGLGFGAEFIPIYQAHPNAHLLAVCQRDPKKLKTIQDAFGIPRGYTDYDELLQDPDIDAVHINTPIPDHAEQSIKALKAGKHVACTVPMATSIADCKRIVDLTKKTGLNYMMMETVVYAREYLYVKELYDRGDLGKIQFLQASHQQDMDGWPNYWPGLPPMWYATHCVGPMLALTDATAEYVSCFGSGTIRKELVKTTVRPSPSRPPTSNSKTPISPRASSARSLIPPANTARASTSTARKNPSSGRSSNTSRTFSTPRKNPSIKSRKRSKPPTTRSACQKASRNSRLRASTISAKKRT